MNRQARTVSLRSVILPVALALALAALLLANLPSRADTMVPPDIAKSAQQTQAAPGQPVTYSILVVNPSPEEGLPWEDLVVTDPIDAALRIDDVQVQPAVGDVLVVDHTVVVTVDSLAPEDSFAVLISCTLVGPVEVGQVISNQATLEYNDPEGVPQPPAVSEPWDIVVVQRSLLPIVLRAAP